MRRPFLAISHVRGLEASYDAVVIGAGIGGLICANLLARAGLRVLLIEQHTMVGGYCSTFTRRGYTFDASSHFYPLLGNRSTITGRLLDELGVATGWIKMDPVDQFHLPDGSTFAVPADYEAYLARLKREFPEEAKAIDGFFRSVRRLYLLGVMEYFEEVDTGRLGADQQLSVRDALDHWFSSPRLKLLLTADCPHWGAPPSRTSFVFDSMLRLSYFLGNYYPRGGSQAFADELAQRFEEQGGHILLKAKVNRIVTRKGRAVGVEVETGPPRDRSRRTVATGVVVSNADLRQTILTMLAREDLGPSYCRRLSELRPTYPCFLSHIGVEGVSTETLERIHGYHWRSWDSERVGMDAFRFKLFVPTLYEPRLAPPCVHVLIIQKVTEIDFDTIRDWASHKQALEDEVMAYLRRLLPPTARIVVQLSASAMTAHRFTLNDRGAMLGWEMSPDQLGAGRPDVRGPVRGLYFVGQWTRPGGGITPVIVSAMRVAGLIARGHSRYRPPSSGVSVGREPTVAARAADLVGPTRGASEGSLP
jgi:phytoene dehydrogenase-like protein